MVGSLLFHLWSPTWLWMELHTRLEFSFPSKFTFWLFDCNFVYRRYPATLLITEVDDLTSPERKCNIHVYYTPIYPRDIISKSLVLVHAGYLFCNWHPLNINYWYGTTCSGMPGSFNSSQMNAWFRSVRTLVKSLFWRTRAVQNIAPEGIRTQHLSHAM